MKKLIIIICLLAVSLNSAVAAGISITPSKLEFKLETGQKQTEKLTVSNITDSPLVYSFYADELRDQIIAQPTTLRLEPNEVQEIKVIANPRHKGTYLTNLSVLAQDLDKKEFNAVAGVKVPLEMIVLPSSHSSFYKNIIWYIIILLILIVAVIMFVNYRRRRKPLWQRIGDSINLMHTSRPWWRRITKK
jgi:hypothetical protein